MPRSLRPLLTAIRTLGRLGAPGSSDRGARPTDESLLAALTAGRTVAWEWDLRTDRVVRTQNAPGLLGLPVTNAADHGQTFERLIHPEDRERVRPDATELMTHILQGRGAEVRTARSAREGFALLETWRPDVLICDIEMPEENGYDFIARVRVLPDPRAAVPAIAVTAYARTEDRVRAIGARFTSHIPKPVEPVELVTVVGALARRAR